MPDFSRYKLGVKAVKTDSRTLQLGRYLTPALPKPPHSLNWIEGMNDFGMMDNDQTGDCTIATCGHAIQVWSKNAAGVVKTPPDDVIMSAYEDWCGYVPGDAATDNGGIMLDVFSSWHHDGLGGITLDAFLSVDHTYLPGVQDAVMLFGGVALGLALPLTAQTQDVWDVVPDAPHSQTVPGSWGGHAVWAPAYDGDANTLHGVTVISWGQPLRMTKKFFQTYVQECWVLYSQAWLTATGTSPNGFLADQLMTDLHAIR